MDIIESPQFRFELTTDGLQVQPNHAKNNVLLPWIWLRDHCRATHSYNQETSQRRHTPLELDLNISANALQWENSEDELVVQWNNKETASRYPSSFFHDIINTDGISKFGDCYIEPKLWNATTLNNALPFAEFQAIADGDSAWLMQLAEYGFVIIQNASPNMESVQVIADTIGHIRETNFGGLWTLESGSNKHQDTAYGYEALGAHTDSTYCPDAPGLQLLLCAESAEKGGESTLVDGYKIAEIIRNEDPALYDLLRTLSIPAEYLETDTHLRASRPMFYHSPESGRLTQVSYNCYDRSAFLPPLNQMQQFYLGVRRFHELSQDNKMTWKYKLQSGEAILFDNWRLLHGRCSFAGYRKFHGCYLNRETLQSRLRVTFNKTI